MANVVTPLLSKGTFTVLPSAARIATPDSQEFEVVGNVSFSGLQLVIDVTAIVATPLVTVTVQGVDRVSGKVHTLLATTAGGIAAVATTVLKIGPGLTAAANSVAVDYVPPVFRVTVSHGDADSITYSIAGQLVG